MKFIKPQRNLVDACMHALVALVVGVIVCIVVIAVYVSRRKTTPKQPTPSSTPPTPSNLFLFEENAGSKL